MRDLITSFIYMLLFGALALGSGILVCVIVTVFNVPGVIGFILLFLTGGTSYHLVRKLANRFGE